MKQLESNKKWFNPEVGATEVWTGDRPVGWERSGALSGPWWRGGSVDQPAAGGEAGGKVAGVCVLSSSGWQRRTIWGASSRLSPSTGARLCLEAIHYILIWFLSSSMAPLESINQAR